MASPMRLRDELARDMHASLYLDLGAEEATSPTRPSSRQRTDRLAAGGVDHTVSHGMALHLPDATEERAEVGGHEAAAGAAVREDSDPP